MRAGVRRAETIEIGMRVRLVLVSGEIGLMQSRIQVKFLVMVW